MPDGTSSDTPSITAVISFKGRLSRSSFWLIYVPGTVVLLLLTNSPQFGPLPPLAVLLLGCVKRLRDVNGLPWLTLGAVGAVTVLVYWLTFRADLPGAGSGGELIVIGGWFLLMAFGFLMLGTSAGTDGPNRYGPTPFRWDGGGVLFWLGGWFLLVSVGVQML